MPDIDMVMNLPKNFLSKNVNEPFIKFIMGKMLGPGEWRQGNPNIKEPDYFYNDAPLEFTLASNRKKKGANFIEQIKRYEYGSDDLEKDVIDYIKESIEAKKRKTYSVENVSVCVLCLLEMYSWVSDEFDPDTHFIVDYRRAEFFKELQTNYIKSGAFKNLYLIIPGLHADWWVCNICADEKYEIQLDNEMILSGKYPYILPKKIYESLKSIHK